MKISKCRQNQIKYSVTVNDAGNGSSAHFLEFPLKIFPVLSKDDPEAWGKESDNQYNLAFFLLFEEDLREPVKKLTIQTRQSRA